MRTRWLHLCRRLPVTLALVCGCAHSSRLGETPIRPLPDSQPAEQSRDDVHYNESYMETLMRLRAVATEALTPYLEPDTEYNLFCEQPEAGHILFIASPYGVIQFDGIRAKLSYPDGRVLEPTSDTKPRPRRPTGVVFRDPIIISPEMCDIAEMKLRELALREALSCLYRDVAYNVDFVREPRRVTVVFTSMIINDHMVRVRFDIAVEELSEGRFQECNGGSD